MLGFSSWRLWAGVQVFEFEVSGFGVGGCMRSFRFRGYFSIGTFGQTNQGEEIKHSLISVL